MPFLMQTLMDLDDPLTHLPEQVNDQGELPSTLFASCIPCIPSLAPSQTNAQSMQSMTLVWSAAPDMLQV